MFEAALRLYRYIGESENDVEAELKKLGDIIKTRSQLNKDVEYIAVTRISHGDVKGLIVLRGDREKVLNELDLIATLVRSSFKSIDVEPVSEDLLSSVLQNIRSFLRGDRILVASHQ